LPGRGTREVANLDDGIAAKPEIGALCRRSGAVKKLASLDQHIEVRLGLPA
jgi:hypothetical protein